MPKVLVLFYSRTGNTAALADAVAEGAESVKFTEVELRRIEDLAPAGATEAGDASRSTAAAPAKKYRTLESVESLAQYDALIIGGSVRDGMMSAALTQALEQASALGAGRALAEKVGSAFVSASTPASDRESNIISMLVPLMRLGMIIVPPAPGAAHVAEPSGAPSGAELAAAREHGARVAKVAEWVRHAKSHEAHGHRH